MDSDARKIFFQAHLLSHINYASTVWSGASEVHLKKLNSLHRRAAKLILPDQSLSTTEKINKLNILPLHKRLNFNQCVTMFKIHTGKAPPYLSDFLHRPPARYGSNNYVLPRPRTARYGSNNYVLPRPRTARYGSNNYVLPRPRTARYGSNNYVLPRPRTARYGSNNYVLPRPRTARYGSNNYVLPRPHTDRYGSNNYVLPRPRIDQFKTSFAFSGSSAWNTLPPKLKIFSSLCNFKINLRKFLPSTLS